VELASIKRLLATNLGIKVRSTPPFYNDGASGAAEV
jgi:hypothetical protein